MKTRVMRRIAVAIALSLVGVTTSAAQAAPPGRIAGSGQGNVICGGDSWCGLGVGPMALTLVPKDGRTWFSLCDVHGWCGFGPLWTTALNVMSCSVVSGDTWYGGVWIPNNGSQWWWAFKVVDGGVARDRVGLRISRWKPDSEPCGTDYVTTSPVLAGDFRITRP